MHHTRPHLRLAEAGLAGAAIGIGNILLWRLILGPRTLPEWAFGLIAVPSVLLLMGLATAAQWRTTDRHRRRAHTRPGHTRKEA